jgi:hypothetical protein
MEGSTYDSRGKWECISIFRGKDGRAVLPFHLSEAAIEEMDWRRKEMIAVDKTWNAS